MPASELWNFRGFFMSKILMGHQKSLEGIMSLFKINNLDKEFVYVAAPAVALSSFSAYFSAMGGYEFGSIFTPTFALSLGAFMILSEVVIFSYPVSLRRVEGGVGVNLIKSSKMLAHGLSIMALTYGIYAPISQLNTNFINLKEDSIVLKADLKSHDIDLKEMIASFKADNEASSSDKAGIAKLETDILLLQGKPFKGSTLWEYTDKCTSKKWIKTCSKLNKKITQLDLKNKLLGTATFSKADIESLKLSIKTKRAELKENKDKSLKGSVINAIIPDSLGLVGFGLLVGLLLGLAIETLKSAAILTFWAKPKLNETLTKYTPPPKAGYFGNISTDFGIIRDNSGFRKSRNENGSRFDSKSLIGNETETERNLNETDNSEIIRDFGNNSETTVHANYFRNENESHFGSKSLKDRSTETERNMNEITKKVVNFENLASVTSLMVESIMPSLKLDSDHGRDIIEGITLLLNQAAPDGRLFAFKELKIIKERHAGAKFMTNHFYTKNLKGRLIDLKLIKVNGKILNWNTNEFFKELFD